MGIEAQCVHPHVPLCLQVLCWGVRDMKRFQLLQVTSPLVEFECGGVSVKSKNIKNTKDNPNFPDPVLSFDVVSLPVQAAHSYAVILCTVIVNSSNITGVLCSVFPKTGLPITRIDCMYTCWSPLKPAVSESSYMSLYKVCTCMYVYNPS